MLTASLPAAVRAELLAAHREAVAEMRRAWPHKTRREVRELLKAAVDSVECYGDEAFRWAASLALEMALDEGFPPEEAVGWRNCVEMVP